MIRFRSLRWLFLALFLIVLTALPAPSALADTTPAASAPACSAAPTHTPLSCFAWSVDWRSWFGNRRRIVQVTVVALCVGILLLIRPTNRI